MSFMTELKRRNVVRVGIAYVVASWLLVQVGDIARESFGAPDWVMKMVITALIAGLPIVLVFSWAYEITPEGIKKESEIEPDLSATGATAKKLDYVTITLLIGAIALIGLDRFVLERPAAATAAGPTTIASATGDSSTPTEAAAPAPGSSAANSAIGQNSIAVLPFVNMSDDPDQEYFSDGISEELLNLLAKVDGLKVASRTSAFAYKGNSTSIPEIAQALKVANVLEGSVRKSGNRVRITAQLIDTRNDRHLWSESFDRELVDIFLVQDEIATAIVAALRTELGLELDAETVSVTAVTGNMTAYDLYLKGREMVIARRTLLDAVDYLSQAVELDPEFARAWAMLGTAAYLATSWEVMTDEETAAGVAQANTAIDQALELDPNLSQSWALKGMLIQAGENGPEYREPLKLHSKAIELDPGNATAWLWRGIRKAEVGYHRQASEDFEQCLAIDPAYQNCRRHLAITMWVIGEGERALALYTEVARSGFSLNDGVYVPMLMDLGNTLGAYIGSSYFENTFPNYPTEIWLNALENPEQDHSRSIPVALDWFENAGAIPIGSKQQMFLALRAYDQLQPGDSVVNNWLWFPTSQHLRDSPHFQRLLEELNLPGHWEEFGLPEGCVKQGGDYICNPITSRPGRAGDGT